MKKKDWLEGPKLILRNDTEISAIQPQSFNLMFCGEQPETAENKHVAEFLGSGCGPDTASHEEQCPYREEGYVSEFPVLGGA